MGSSQPPMFADLLRRFRVAAGLTQEELAERAGLSAKGISDLERGARTNPRRDTVALVADALGLSEREREMLAASGRRHAPAGPALASAAVATPATAVNAVPLIGRKAELELLGRHLAGQGTPVLMLAGEPGIGKTRLLQEASRRAVEAGYTVLSGGCHRRSGQEPYEPVLTALDRHLSGLSRAERKQALRGCELLVRLLPELSEAITVPAYAMGLAAAQERRLLLAAIARYLAQVAGPAGTLLVLDDLHWAGEDALDVVAFLARTTSSRPLRLLIAFRDTEVRAHQPLAALCADLTREGLAERTLVAPLAHAEARVLLDKLLSADHLPDEGDGERSDAVLQRAGGIPFYLVNMAQAIHASAAGDHAADLPWSVAETIRQRVTALPEEARTLLGAAAVVGRVIERRVLLALARAAGLGEAEAVAALDAAGAARLLVPEGDLAYTFAHDLVRETLLQDLGTARRAHWHHQLAEVLEQQPGEPAAATLAYHYERGGDDAKAGYYHEAAGDHARAMYAAADALDHYRAALKVLDALCRPRDVARVREKLGATLVPLGRYDEALLVLDQAAAAYRAAGDRDGLARATAQIGWAHGEQGTTDAGLARLLPAVDEFEGAEAVPGLAMLYVALARLYFIRGSFDQQVAAAERAAEIARGRGDQVTLLLAEEQRARGLNLLGRIEEGARALAEEVLPLAEAMGDVRTLFRAVNNLGAAYGYWGEFARERPYIERALALATRLGDPADILYFTFRMCLNAFELGEWVTARTHLARAEELLGDAPVSRAAAHVPLARAQLDLATGDVESGLRHAEAALALAQQSHDFQLQAGAQSLLAEWDLFSGHPDAALARLAPLVEGSHGTGSFANTLLSLLAWARLEQGDLDDARGLATRAVELAAGANMRRSWALALLVKGRVALRQEHWDEAERALVASVELCRAMPCPYGEAKALYALGLFHAQRGERDQACERLEAAREICVRMGERLYLPAIEHALATVSVERA